MFNKKGQAPNEWRGILTFMFVVVITGLFFFGCVVATSTKEYEKFQFSKEEVEVTRDLNYILGKPVGQGKTIAGLIIENTQVLYVDGQHLEFIDRVNDEIKGYFAGYSRFMILNDVGGCLYDSNGRECLYRESSYLEIAEGSAILPIPFENKFESIEVVLQSLLR